MWQIRKLKEDLIGGLLGLSIAFVIITFMYSYYPVLIEHSTTTSKDKPLEIQFNKEFEYCREITYKRDAKVTVSKSYVKNMDTGEMISIPYGTYHYFREAVNNKMSCKVMIFKREMLNNVISLDNIYGRWTIETYVEIDSFPFWKQGIKLQDIYLDVQKDK